MWILLDFRLIYDEIKLIYDEIQAYDVVFIGLCDEGLWDLILNLRVTWWNDVDLFNFMMKALDLIMSYSWNITGQ